MSDARIPGLLPHELESLALIAEECAEVVAIIGKALRHGLDSCHPVDGTVNRDEIARELGQVGCAIQIAIDLGILRSTDIDTGLADKWKNVGRFLHHISINRDSRTCRIASPTKWEAP